MLILLNILDHKKQKSQSIVQSQIPASSSYNSGVEAKSILLESNQTYHNQFYTFRINFDPSKGETKHTLRTVVLNHKNRKSQPVKTLCSSNPQISLTSKIKPKLTQIQTSLRSKILKKNKNSISI